MVCCIRAASHVIFAAWELLHCDSFLCHLVTREVQDCMGRSSITVSRNTTSPPISWRGNTVGSEELHYGLLPRGSGLSMIVDWCRKEPYFSGFCALNVMAEWGPQKQTVGSDAVVKGQLCLDLLSGFLFVFLGKEIIAFTFSVNWIISSGSGNMHLVGCLWSAQK